jgi:hypothetical protein
VHWVNQDGTTGGPSLGYTSGAGWDACTGLGVLDGTKLLAALQSLTANKVAPNSTATNAFTPGTTGTRTSPVPAVPQHG